MDIKSELTRHGFTFSKRYGQNFITDTNFLNSVVEKSGVTAGDTVVEIGAGAGTLTAALAAKAARVIAFEIDESLKPVLESTVGGLKNVELKFCDFLKAGDVSEIVGESYKVVANLPYYITTPLIFKLLEDTAVLPETVSVMVQREVADRLCAREGSKDYGALTVAVDARYEAKKIIDVNRTMFYPVPNVDSAVVLMKRRTAKENVDFEAFARLVRASFAMRRKTLVNNLSAAFGGDKSFYEEILKGLGLPVTVRGEALSTEMFFALQAALSHRVMRR